MLLGPVYLTGGGKKGQKDNLPKTMTLSFWDKEARGSSYQYVKLSMHSDESLESIAFKLIALGNDLKAGRFLPDRNP